MNRRLVPAAFFLCVLLGCSTSLKIVSDFSDPSYSVGQVSAQSKMKLTVASAVSVLEFNKSFDKEYHSAEEFVPVVQKQIADSMKSILGCAVTEDQSGQMPADMVQALASASEDFFFIVKYMEISNKVKTSAPVYTPTGGFKGGGSSESCVVKLKAELWSVKEKKRLLAYEATGQSKVTMMFYGTALKAAVDNAVRYMVRYLKTGAVL